MSFEKVRKRVSKIGWPKMDPRLNKAICNLFLVTTEPPRLRILAPAPYLQLLKKPHHLLPVLYQACRLGRLKGNRKNEVFFFRN